MDTNVQTKNISITTAALLVAVTLLATSTVYFAFLSAKPTSAATVGSNTYPIQGFFGNVTPLGTDSTGSSSTTGNSITVSGAGAATYISNEALISVSVVTTGTTAVGASSSNAAATENVVKALNGIGVSNSSIQTQGYYLNANYANCYSSCTPQITGYTVTNTLQVNITSSDPSQLGLQSGRAIDTAVGAGANQVSLSFAETNSELSKLSTGALQQAVGSAYGQAQTMAKALGVNITGVISASQGQAYTPQYNYMVFAANLSPVSTPIVPGTHSLTVYVQVVYAIS